MKFKKLLAVLLTTAISLLFIPAVSAASGDIFTASDALIVLKASTGEITLTDAQKERYGLTGDITAADALTILRKSLESTIGGIPAAERDDGSPAAGERNAVIEYGEPYVIRRGDAQFSAYIRFPQSGSPTDDIIRQWAGEVYRSAYDEVSDLLETDADAEGEINVQFDSYFINGRYAGIIADGMFITSHMANSQSIVKTFNIDAEDNIMLSNADILDYSQSEDILALLREKIILEHSDISDSVDVSDMDERALEHIYLHHDGVVVVLERGIFLPAYIGAVKVTLPYGELGSAFLLW